MLVKDIEDVLFFKCQQCFEFPFQPKQCDNDICQRFYCRNCNKSFRQSNCPCNEFSDMDPIIRYVYDNLIIMCSQCNQIHKLNQFKLHQIRCDKNIKISEYSNEIKCVYCQNQIKIDVNNIINHNSKCQNLIIKQQNNFDRCFYSQEYIDQLEQFTMRCNICYLQGNKIQMINHKSVCNQATVSCICGLQIQRFAFKDHFKLCLQTTLQKEKQNLAIEQLILNVKNIEITQNLISCQQSSLSYQSLLSFALQPQGFSSQNTRRY